MVTPDTVYLVWIGSIVILLVVTGVVGLLLALVLGTARRILNVVGDIGTDGKLVANNTPLGWRARRPATG